MSCKHNCDASFPPRARARLMFYMLDASGLIGLSFAIVFSVCDLIQRAIFVTVVYIYVGRRKRIMQLFCVIEHWILCACTQLACICSARYGEKMRLEAHERAQLHLVNALSINISCIMYMCIACNWEITGCTATHVHTCAAYEHWFHKTFKFETQILWRGHHSIYS